MIGEGPYQRWWGFLLAFFWENFGLLVSQSQLKKYIFGQSLTTTLIF